MEQDRTDYPFLVVTWLHSEHAKLSDKSKNFIGDRPYRHFDGRISLESNEARIIQSLNNPELLSKHSFLPFIRKDKKLRRFTKDKTTKKVQIGQKVRPIMYASHRDSCIYSFYAYVLKSLYEERIKSTELSQSILAYRHIALDNKSERGKSNVDFAKEIADLSRTHKNCAVLCLDIEKYFDRMDHQLIKRRWSRLINRTELPIGHYTVFKNITKYRYVFIYDALIRLGYGIFKNGKFIYKKNVANRGLICSPKNYRRLIDSTSDSLIHKNANNRGIPQGSPISDVIANFYLEDFDLDILSILRGYGFGYYRRYSDDILIVCPVDKVNDIYEYAIERIASDRLNIKPEKTEALIIDNTTQTITDCTFAVTGNKKHENSHRQAFQYLGFEIDTKDMHIRSGTIAGHYRRAKRKAIMLAKNADRAKTVTDGDNRPKKSRKNRSPWQYFINVNKKIRSKRVKTQYKRVLKRVRSFKADK